jgi:hypothetical protein
LLVGSAGAITAIAGIEVTIAIRIVTALVTFVAIIPTQFSAQTWRAIRQRVLFVIDCLLFGRLFAGGLTNGIALRLLFGGGAVSGLLFSGRLFSGGLTNGIALRQFFGGGAVSGLLLSGRLFAGGLTNGIALRLLFGGGAVSGGLFSGRLFTGGLCTRRALHGVIITAATIVIAIIIVA